MIRSANKQAFILTKDRVIKRFYEGFCLIPDLCKRVLSLQDQSLYPINSKNNTNPSKNIQ